MKISEIEAPGKTLDQLHKEWVVAYSPDGATQARVWSQAIKAQAAGMEPARAHNSALSAVNSSNDRRQDRALNQRQADRKDKPFVGVPMKQKGTPPTASDSPKTRGGQIGNQNAYRGGPKAKAGPGKNGIDVMKDKWDDFNKVDGLAGKSAAKGSMISKYLNKAAGEIVAMGDRARRK